MSNSIRPFLAALVVLVCVEHSCAGVIVVSGDTNIINALTGVSTSIDAGNQRFFLNVLGAGSNVVILNQSLVSIGSLDTELNNFYNGVGGVTSTLVGGTITGATLAGVNLFVAPSLDDAFTAPEIAIISSFLSGGGTFFIMGENSNSAFAASNAAVNSALTDLGSSIDLVPDLFDSGFNLATIVSDSLTVGVSSFKYAAPSRVSGGTTLFFGSSDRAILAYESMGTASVPEPSSLTLFGLGSLCAIGLLRARGRRSKAIAG